ncbi:DUF6090 family protein [Roseivirga sp. E12]|uniref:DUF6090 family protein n=1 Tax=Roseivirga sp. E12 TaxID=2819237 RepID=UPI001ABC9B64|nr:DUF6090 family protein [Roseivirga sp. E12]MBO3697926.1 hypothetical protein [Roseivirga sp. E12]
MIFLLRKLRNKMVEGGKVKRYLLYAVGEILLVVIGIVLAVQVNNWNQARNLKKSANSHLLLFKQDLKLDLAELKRLDSLLEIQYHAADSVLMQFKTLIPVDGSFAGNLTYLVLEYNFKAETKGFVLLSNSGEIAALEDSLQNQIAEYYALVESVKEREAISNTFIKDKYEVAVMIKHPYLWGKHNRQADVDLFYEDDPRPPTTLDYPYILADKSLEVLAFGRRFQIIEQAKKYAEAIMALNKLISMLD